jgi:hypothetical protein
MRRNIGRVLTRRRAALAAAALLVACHAPQGPLPGGRGVIGVEPVAEPAPLVRIRTVNEIGAPRHLRARLEVTRDAYVLAFNVGPDGVVKLIFPEDPEDSGFLRGGATYALQPIFTGYPTMSLTWVPAARFVRVRMSALARPTMRGPGYVFVLASRTPFDLQPLATAGYFDGVEAGFTYNELDPEDVIPAVAAAAMGDREGMAVRADFARYGGYDETLAPYGRAGLYAYSPTAPDCELFTTSLALFSLDPTYAPGLRCPWGATTRPPVPRVRIPRMPSDSTPGDSTPSDSTAGDTIATSQPVSAMVREARAFRTNDRTVRPPVELTPDARERMRQRDAAVERRMRREVEAGVSRRHPSPRDEAGAPRRARPEARPARPEPQPEQTPRANPRGRSPDEAKPAPQAPDAKPTKEIGRVDRDAP